MYRKRENMLLTEWNRDDALQVRWEEGWESADKRFSELVSNAKTLDDLKRLMETSLPKQQNSGAGTA
jgi:DNA-binding transcriptional regulator/RsmH inhibitor MraZ